MCLWIVSNNPFLMCESIYKFVTVMHCFPIFLTENMTSWEGFNFALVGLVDELVALGAKPSFKMTVLKLWTDYLRRMEVAFYSKEGAAVPKLGPNFKK